MFYEYVILENSEVKKDEARKLPVLVAKGEVIAFDEQGALLAIALKEGEKINDRGVSTDRIKIIIRPFGA